MDSQLTRFITLQILLLIGIQAHCQVPSKFNYQALIRNNNAAISSQTVGVKISILKGSTTGVIVYSETHTTNSSPLGVISIEIGGGNKLTGDIENINWADGPYFIKIETDIEGGANYQLIGTTQLLSVPYALHAKSASNGYPKADSLKLLGISEGAEVNVNADWNAVSGDAQILNKPVVDGSETKLTPGLNMTINGNGTSASPYVINTKPFDTVPKGNVVGDLLYWSGIKWNTLPRGNPGQVLTVNSSGLPTWQYLTSVSNIEQSKKYFRTSFELSNFNEWINIDSVYKSETEKENAPILITTEICQFDFDGDGLEDIYCADPLTWANNNHSIVIYKNMGGRYLKTDYGIPQSNGCKVLVGDYNNDSRPDVFSLSAIDLPGGGPGLYPNYLYLNNGNNTMTRVEIPGIEFWYAGASGDIDNDDDLDVVLFNFHVAGTGEKNKILWNDGHGNFTTDYTWIGDVTEQVDNAELADLNSDGYLDLIYNRPIMPEGYGTNNMVIMWGNGHGFSETHKTTVPITNIYPILDINFLDVDGDNVTEIVLLFFNYLNNQWEIEMFKTDKTFQTYTNVTDLFIRENKKKDGDNIMRYLRVQDVDKNGKMDIFSTDKKSNILWEQDIDGVFKRKY